MSTMLDSPIMYDAREDMRLSCREDFSEWEERCSDRDSDRRMDYDRWTPVQRQVIESHVKEFCLQSREVCIAISRLHIIDHRMAAYAALGRLRDLLPILDGYDRERAEGAMQDYEEVITRTAFRDADPSDEIVSAHSERISRFEMHSKSVSSMMFAAHLESRRRDAIVAIGTLVCYPRVLTQTLRMTDAAEMSLSVIREIQRSRAIEGFSVAGAPDRGRTSFDLASSGTVPAGFVSPTTNADFERDSLERIAGSVTEFIDKMVVVQSKAPRATSKPVEGPLQRFLRMGSVGENKNRRDGS